MIGGLHIFCEIYQITHGTMGEFVVNPVCLPNQHKQVSMASLATKYRDGIIGKPIKHSSVKLVSPTI